MINPIALGDVIEFTLPEDKEDPTIWLIGPVSSILKTKLETSFMDVQFDGNKLSKVTQKVPMLEQNIKIVQFGLKGFKNFKLNGREVPCKMEKVKFSGTEVEIMSEETIAYIPRSIIVSLAQKIWDENQVSQEEEKN